MRCPTGEMGDAATVELWFWNGLPADAREITGALLARTAPGEDEQTGWTLSIGGTAAAAGRLVVTGNQGGETIRLTSDRKLKPKKWYHVAVVRREAEIAVFLDGRKVPVIDGALPGVSDGSKPRLVVGNRPDGRFGFAGKIDEVAAFDAAFPAERIAAHVEAAGRPPPPESPATSHPEAPRRAERPRGPDVRRRLRNAIDRAEPAAYWPLQAGNNRRAADGSGHERPARFEEGAGPLRSPEDPNFQGGRMRATLPDLGKTYSIEMWVSNGRPTGERPVTGDFFSRGPAGHSQAAGDHLGIGGTRHGGRWRGRLIFFQRRPARRCPCREDSPFRRRMAPRRPRSRRPIRPRPSRRRARPHRHRLGQSGTAVGRGDGRLSAGDGRRHGGARRPDPGADGQRRRRPIRPIDGVPRRPPDADRPHEMAGGVLVTAAAKILYAEDTTGDGTADRRKILCRGFKAGNPQLRINGLRWGLDNWIYAANGGHHAGYGKNNRVEVVETGAQVAVGSRDFQMRPEEDALEPQSGPSQFGRNRNDWGHWFGVQNTHLLWHCVLRDHYLRRNPKVASPSPKNQLLPTTAELFPAKPPQKRFHSTNQAGRFTSACSAVIYRDRLLFGGKPGRDQAFVCAPFHNLVHHAIVEPKGVSFTASRALEGTEFLASESRLFRPVAVRTGPDGALWVVDIARSMIEHPRWLPKKGAAAGLLSQKGLARPVHAGAEAGRRSSFSNDGGVRCTRATPTSRR